MNLCDLPGDLHNEIISCLPICARLNLRRTCKIMEAAVADSDFHVGVDESQISISVRSRLLRSGVRNILMTAIFDEQLKFSSKLEDFENYARLRQRLFKRAIACRVSIDLKNVHNDTVDIVERLLEGCVFQKLEYSIHGGGVNSQLRSFFGNYENADLSLFIHGSFIDCDLLLSISRPIEVYWRSNLLNEEAIAASERHQFLEVTILRSVYDEFLKTQGIRRTEEGYIKCQTVAENPSCITPRTPGQNMELKYQGARLVEYPIDELNALRTSIKITND